MLDAIIFDLDATAVPNGHRGEPSRALRDAVSESRDVLKLSVATGRAWPDAKSIVQGLELNQPVIIAGGTCIVDPRREQIIWQLSIPSATTQNIFEIARRYPYRVGIGYDLNLRYFDGHSYLSWKEGASVVYILDIGDRDELESISRDLGQIEGITVSWATAWGVEDGLDIHITNSQATKEHAVIELCSLIGVDRENTAGVGDGYNDIHLFNAVGHKVAMGNAVLELKEAADEVIGSVDEEGLATFIRMSAQGK